jgi:hypothetical protein
MFVVCHHVVMFSSFFLVLSFIWREREELFRTRILWLRASSTRMFLGAWGLGEASIPPFLAAFPCFLQYADWNKDHFQR